MDATQILYKGWIIEPETEAWPLHFKLKYRYHREGDEQIYNAYTVEEAIDAIWDKEETTPMESVRTYTKQEVMDKVIERLRSLNLGRPLLEKDFEIIGTVDMALKEPGELTIGARVGKSYPKVVNA